jgi:hypothetical protein
MAINYKSVCSIFISKNNIENSLMSTFKGRLYTDTYNKYKQIHVLEDYVSLLMTDEDKYKAINPLEQKPGEIIIPGDKLGVILVFPVDFLLDSTKLNLTNELNPDKTINEDKTNAKLNYIFDNILGYTYISFDIVRNIICLYDLYINDNIAILPAPLNTTPYLDTVIQSNFLALNHNKILYGIRETPNVSMATPYASPDISYDITNREDQYKLWGKIIMESIINTLVLFPFTATIWVGVDINNVKIDNWFDIMMHILLYSGFSNPYFSTKDPLNKDYKYKFVGLTKTNDIKFVTDTEISNEYNKVLYLFNQNIINCKALSLINNCICKINFSFNKETVLWLLRLPFNTWTVNINPDGTKNLSQKEFSGAFKIKNVKCENKKELDTRKLYNYTDDKGNTGQGYILEIYAIRNKVKILPKSISELKGNLFLETDLQIVDIKNLFESCNYNINNFICELELDKRSISYSGDRVKTLDNIINNIKQTYKNANTQFTTDIKKNLDIITQTSGVKDYKRFYNRLKTVDPDNEETIARITIELKNSIQETHRKIEKETQNVDKEIQKLIKENETKITDLIKKLVDNNISDLGYMLSGKENSVTQSKGLIVFHTHPNQFYINNKCNIAFPSGPDFTSFLEHFIYFNSISSVVVTVEGLYVISINEKMCEQHYIEKIKQALISTNLSSRISYYFGFLVQDFKTPQDFCNTINGMKFDDKKFCDSLNDKISKNTSPDFYINEYVLFEPGNINTKIINIKEVNGIKLFDLIDTNGVTQLDVSQDKIKKNTKYSTDFFENIKKINLEKQQNIEPALAFLYQKLSYPLFRCEFKTWTELLEPDNNNFNITYSQKGSQCIVDSETIEIVEKLYNNPGIGSFYKFDTSIPPSSNLSKTFTPITSVYDRKFPDNIDTSFKNLDISDESLDTSFGSPSYKSPIKPGISPIKPDISPIKPGISPIKLDI